MEEAESEKGEKPSGIWTVTKETVEIEAERSRERAARKSLEEGLARCPVCGGRAKVVEFGLEGNGVWIGCDETDECVRFIEIHTEGWSVEEVAAEWNRYNSGVFRVIRSVKMWFRRHFGAEKRREMRENREILKEKREKEAKMREIFGVEGPKRGSIWRRFLARRQKVDGNASVR